MAETLKGIDVTRDIVKKLSAEVEILKEKGTTPTLAIVRVGNKEDDIYYQQSAVKRCEPIGINVEEYAYEESITEEELINAIINLNLDDSINGVLILRPLPKHISDHRICATLDPRKDIDGITDDSLAGIIKNEAQGFAPCTARACIEILKYFGVEPRSKKAVVIGRSLVVGKPVALMLTALDATVTVCHTKTEDMPSVARQGDILIVAAGRAKIVGKEYIKEGAVVIDVGINLDENGKLVGDVNYEEALQVAGSITPVPGGVGTVTTAVLAMHVVEAAKRQSL